jgi:hypothetical protein
MKTGKRPLPQLEQGQLWKTNGGYVQIWHIGKRLIDYRMMKQLGQESSEDADNSH